MKKILQHHISRTIKQLEDLVLLQTESVVEASSVSSKLYLCCLQASTVESLRIFPEKTLNDADMNFVEGYLELFKSIESCLDKDIQPTTNKVERQVKDKTLIKHFKELGGTTENAIAHVIDSARHALGTCIA